MNKKILVMFFTFLFICPCFIFGFGANYTSVYADVGTEPTEYTMTQVVNGQAVTIENVVTINNTDELRAFSSFVNDENNWSNVRNITFKLTRNVELNENSNNFQDWEYESPTNIWTPIGTTDSYFSGCFDGQGFTISGVYINNTEDYQGLFGYVDHNGKIINVKTINYRITGGSKVGGLAGYNKGIISNCITNGIVCSERTDDWTSLGGIVGTNDVGATVINCCNLNVVRGGGSTGNYCIGGIVGLNYGDIINCYNIGSVVSGADYIGSIVGCFDDCEDGIIVNCYWLIGSGGINDKGTTDSFDENGILQTANNNELNGVNITIMETNLRDVLNYFVDNFYELYATEIAEGDYLEPKHWVSSPFPTLGEDILVITAENNLLWLWILLGITGAGLIALLILWVFIFKRSVKFILNGKQVGIAKYKLNEDLNFPLNLARYKWFIDKEETQLLTQQKMGWLGFVIYRNSVNAPNSKNIDKEIKEHKIKESK